jgi:hypothetical protein
VTFYPLFVLTCAFCLLIFVSSPQTHLPLGTPGKERFAFANSVRNETISSVIWIKNHIDIEKSNYESGFSQNPINKGNQKRKKVKLFSGSNAKKQIF